MMSRVEERTRSRYDDARKRGFAENFLSRVCMPAKPKMALREKPSSLNCCIWRRAKKSYSVEEPGLCIYVHLGQNTDPSHISYQPSEACRVLLMSLLQPLRYHHRAIIRSTSLRQGCRVLRAGTPYRHSALGLEPCYMSHVHSQISPDTDSLPRCRSL